MASLFSQLHSDRNLRFADFGISILYRQVARTTSVATLTVSEEVSDHPVTAMLSPSRQQAATVTGGLHVGSELTVEVMLDQLPAGAPRITDRLVIEQQEYELMACDILHAISVALLQARRRD